MCLHKQVILCWFEKLFPGEVSHFNVTWADLLVIKSTSKCPCHTILTCVKRKKNYIHPLALAKLFLDEERNKTGL